MTGLMQGKRGLIMGLANDKSLAWGIAQKLHEYDCIDRIICADRDPVFAEQLAKRIPNHRFTVVQADVFNDLPRLVPGHDAVVNLVWDPPWDPSKMSDEARLELGML